MHALLGSQDQRTPDAQSIDNTLWGLKELKHAPLDDVVSAMLNRLVVLCRTPDMQPSSQAISISLFACAELGLSIQPTDLEVLLKHLFGVRVSEVDNQHYSNVAWSLAVMGVLTISMFEALLCQMRAKKATSQLTAASRKQLYQALAWLQPAAEPKQMRAWSRLRSRLQAIAPQQANAKLNLPGQAKLQAALALLGMPHKVQVPCGEYRADAVLPPHCSHGAEVVLVLLRPQEFLANVPSR